LQCSLYGYGEIEKATWQAVFVSAPTGFPGFSLPHFLPSALSDFSQKLTVVAPLLPSYQFYEPLKAILLEDGRAANMSFELVYLFLVGSFTFYLSYLLMKRRWLM